jgi:hypothetical protein
MKEILNPSHRLWPIFRRKLDDAVTNYLDGKIQSRCQGDLSLSIRILQSLENIDVKETVMLLQECGGHCDCKVLANVARAWNNR